MARPAKKWRILPAQTDLRANLGRELGISPVVAQVLINRGIGDAASAACFLHAGAESLGDPFLLMGMEPAVERVKYAIGHQEKIVIYGDYDVDGITATALMFRVLEQLGARVEYYIPERQSEGYGLNDTALEALHAGGAKLVITVDCGISATVEVAKMQGRLDIIVTDHHQPPETLPPALAVINPKQPDCPYPDKNLAGVGVAFKLCQALWLTLKSGEASLPGYYDLVAVGTIADIAPLTGENRVLVKLGLKELAATANLGLRALKSICGLTDNKIDAGKVGYIIGPRLNAAGRVSHAAAGVELLVTADAVRAAELAADLDSENNRRQAVEKELLVEAEAMLAAMDTQQAKVLVLAGRDWHSGVIGIVASRLVERYYRPVVMISIKEGIGKGSCRSIPGFDIYKALAGCADILIQFGGHHQAAGFSVKEDAIDMLRQRLNDIAAAWLTADDYIPVLNIDTAVALDELDSAFLEQLACLAPHGMGNPAPVFVSENLAVAGVKPVGQDRRHLKLRVRYRKNYKDVIAWEMGSFAEALECSGKVDLAFLPEFNDWQGQRTIQLKAHDLRCRQPVPAHVTLVDVRGAEDKEGYCLQTARTGKRTLVVVGSRRQAVVLARLLKKNLGGFKVAFSYDALPDHRKERLAQAWQQGAVSVLVATSNFNWSDSADDVIIYDQPAARSGFYRLCRRLATQARPITLKFIYGGDSKPSAREVMETFPDRAAIGRVYLTLKEAAATGVTLLTDRKIANRVQDSYKAMLNETGIGLAVNVLTELRLIRQEARGARRLLRLLPEPAQKLDIDLSSCYKETVTARDDAARWARETARDQLGELWRRATDAEE